MAVDFGKTQLLQELAMRTALDGDPVGFFTPMYKLMKEAWREMSHTLQPVMKRVSTGDHRMELITGGMLDFWTLDNPDAGRSRKYKRVIIDEAGLVKHLTDAWHAAIRPTLADLRGDAWLAGTPKGRNGFWELWELGGRDPSWAHWQMPTDANPFIAREEIAAMRAGMPSLVVAQEVDAEFTEGELTLFSISDIDRAGTPYVVPTAGQWLTTVDVGRRRDATVINTFEIGQRPYRRVHFLRLERVSYPKIQAEIEAIARRFPGQLIVESSGVGDPVVENLNVPATPFLTTAKSKLNALQGLQLLFEQGDILLGGMDARERAALIAESWDSPHTSDECMSLAFFAASFSGVSQGVFV